MSKRLAVRQVISCGLACATLYAQMPVATSGASLATRDVESGVGRPFLRWYRPLTPPPVSLVNSNRLYGVIREGKLYLTVQDAIAAAIENNIDLEVTRYGALLADWQYRRSLAGGPLRGVTGGNTLVNQATSGQGVAGSQASAGLSGGNGGGSGGGGGATVSQIGPVTANLDTVFQNATAFSHTTAPQANTVQSQISALTSDRRIINSFAQQGLLTGGFVQVTANESYLKENTPTDILNPSVAPVVQIFARHNFLQGFGTAVNARFIHVAEKNTGKARETFRSQLLNLVANVLNLYWDLASTVEEAKTRQKALEVSRKFFEDTTNQIRIGAVARVERFRAEAEFKTRQQELAFVKSTQRRQENLLKNVISRTGLADTRLEELEIVPVDSIQIPESDDLPPLRQLVQTALTKRPDMVINKINNEQAEISALGTRNGLLPQLQGIASISAQGLAGTPNPKSSIAPDAYFEGGLGDALGQVFRQNFKNRRAAVVFQGVIQNRVAQADYGIEQLQIKQGDLIERRAMNQLVVELSNQLVAIRQARSRYSAAKNTRELQEDLLSKEQARFRLGDSTIAAIIAAQRAAAAAATAEVAARGTYSHARVALEQVTGELLARNGVAVDAALDGSGSPVAKGNGK